MTITHAQNILGRRDRNGFLLIEALVALVIVTSVFGLLIYILGRVDNIGTWFKRGENEELTIVGKYKLVNEYKGKYKNISVIKRISEHGSIGKKICPYNLVQLNTSNFDITHAGHIRIIDVASSTEITFIRNIKNNIYVGLDSSSSTDPDMLVFQKQTILSRLNPGQDTDISKDESIYSLDSGPGTRSAIVAGNTLFVLMSGTTEHVRAFTFSSAGLPQYMWSYKLPVSGVVAKSFAFDPLTHKIIIGLEKNNVHELFSIRIGTNGEVGAIESREVGGSVNYLFTLDKYVYVLNTLDPEVLIHKTDTLEHIGGYDAPGAVGNGKRLDYLSGGLVFGRTIYGNEISFVSSTSTSPATSTASSSGMLELDEFWGEKIKASIDDIVAIDGGFITLSTKAGGQVDLYSYIGGDNNPEFDSVRSFNLSYGRGTDLFCDTDYLYITARYEPVFYILPIK